MILYSCTYQERKLSDDYSDCHNNNIIIIIQTNSTLLWDLNKNEDDPDFDSLRSQPPRSYNDIVNEVLAQFTGSEGEDDTDGISFAPSWIRRTRHIEAASVKHHDTQEVGEERTTKVSGADHNYESFLNFDYKSGSCYD